MSLTKEDLKSIRKITDSSIEEIAVITKKGFDAVDKHFAQLGERSEQVQSCLDNQNVRLGNLETDMQHLNSAQQDLFKQVQNMDDRLALVENCLKGMSELMKTITRRINNFEDSLDKTSSRVDEIQEQLGATIDRIDIMINHQEDLMTEVKDIRNQLSRNISEKQCFELDARILKLERHLGLAG